MPYSLRCTQNSGISHSVSPVSVFSQPQTHQEGKRLVIGRNHALTMREWITGHVRSTAHMGFAWGPYGVRVESAWSPKQSHVCTAETPQREPHPCQTIRRTSDAHDNCLPNVPPAVRALSPWQMLESS
jgi:hypothetical protein